MRADAVPAAGAGQESCAAGAAAPGLAVAAAIAAAVGAAATAAAAAFDVIPGTNPFEWHCDLRKSADSSKGKAAAVAASVCPK